MVYFLSNEDIASVLNLANGMQAIEEAYREWDAGMAAVRPKTNVYVFNDEESTRYNYVSMEGAIQKRGVYGIRMRSDMYDQAVWISGQKIQKWSAVPGKFCGLVLLFSSKTGAPLAITNDGELMHVMVGGLAGIAAKHMARQDARTLCLIGSLWMAKAHAEAISMVRPISLIKVYSPTREHRLEFAREMTEKLKIEVEATDTAEKAVEGSDIVALCTNALRPVISGEWLRPGMHISCVQNHELGDDVLARVDHIVTNMQKRNWDETFFIAGTPRVPDAARGEGQGFVRMFREGSPRLAEVLGGRAPGRENDQQITFFSNNDGNGLCFTALGELVLRRIGERGDEGINQVPLDWFLESIPD
jgi:ornithine cyclodeaminase/alanine dehydrogenase-like protein (mu-crystallin family)